ncbi:MAG TPA: DUF2970 domain-containing protein [Rubrivivax sp.]|mgnify:CR=1 FL=1|nr:DUF2970 domain-containing protein [Burkholderiaceae bacterium]MCP5289628.1 DUF2970 domain-containing protein [Burkholderiaceae bacterium]HMQ72487.1 DUF2970 domain-containing protein [Rubrivivax sp.]HMR70251.1 DUF2970 domain-containing protein [Rubrivivax sp.]
MSGDLRQAAARPASFGQTVKAVAWSFVGLRRQAAWREDAQRLNPVHVIAVGLAAAALFVLALLLVVRWVVASGVAT